MSIQFIYVSVKQNDTAALTYIYMYCNTEGLCPKDSYMQGFFQILLFEWHVTPA